MRGVKQGVLLVARLATASALAGALSACTQHGQADVPKAASVPADGGQAPQKRQPSRALAQPRSPGPVSVGFAQDMSLHHEQALVMARMALDQGTPAVHALAQAIVNQQLKEIGYMQGWLLLWEEPAAAAVDTMPWMKDAYARAKRRDEAYERFIDRCSTGQGMPGLATMEELAALSVEKGPAFDARFLALMMKHHEGGMLMARFASEFAELDVVRQFAATVVAEQRQELMWMGRQSAIVSPVAASRKPG